MRHSYSEQVEIHWGRPRDNSRTQATFLCWEQGLGEDRDGTGLLEMGREHSAAWGL